MGVGRGVLVLDALGLAAVVVVEVLGLETRPVARQVGEQLPVVVGFEGADLALAVDDEFERRRLDAADGDEVLAQLACRQREEAGERRAPDEVDGLTRLPGGRQVEVDVVGVGEGLPHFAVGDRREADAAHGDVRLLADEFVGLLADEFALAVVVGGDDGLVGPAGQLPEGPDDVLLGGRLDDVGVDQLDRFDVAPVAVLLGEVDTDDVARQAHTPGVTPLVDVDAVAPVDARGPVAQDLGDPAGGVLLFGDQQLHAGSPRRTRCALPMGTVGRGRSVIAPAYASTRPKGFGKPTGSAGVRAHSRHAGARSRRARARAQRRTRRCSEPPLITARRDGTPDSGRLP